MRCWSNQEPHFPDPRRSDDQQPAPCFASTTHGRPPYPLPPIPSLSPRVHRPESVSITRWKRLAYSGLAGALQAVRTEKRPLRHLARLSYRSLYRYASGSLRRPRLTAARANILSTSTRGTYRLAEQAKPTSASPHSPTGSYRTCALGSARPCGQDFVEWNSKPVKSVKTGFKTAVCSCGTCGRVSPPLRHTAATWLMQEPTECALPEHSNAGSRVWPSPSRLPEGRGKARHFAARSELNSS